MSFNYTFSLLGKCLKCQGKQTIKIYFPATGELLQCEQRGPGLLQPSPRLCVRSWCRGASFLSHNYPWVRHHVLQAAMCQFPNGHSGILPLPTTGVRRNQQHWLRLSSASFPQHRMHPHSIDKKGKVYQRQWNAKNQPLGWTQGHPCHFGPETQPSRKQSCWTHYQ